MEDQLNATAAKPHARLEFARRLRELRVPRGFRTARSLARALSIDENRYTRYERAEVEPDLDLLRRICAMLGVTPNDLLGIDGDLPLSAGPSAGALAEAPAGHPYAEARPPALALQSISWLLCGLVVQLRQNHVASPTMLGTSPPSPFAYLQLVTSLQQELAHQPFEVIHQVVRDPAVLDAPAASARELHDLILRLTQALAQSTEPPRSA